MFEAIIAICIAANIDKEPVNRCAMYRSQEIFRTFEDCRKWGWNKQDELHASGVDDGLSVVPHVVCGKINRENT